MILPVGKLVYTIGHSTHSMNHFASLLSKHKITAVADVRSVPYSRTNPQFNRDEMKRALGRCGVVYVFCGAELGARSDDPQCYENGRVRYDRLAQTPIFRQGLDRIVRGMKRYRLAIMCAEKEPLECHRGILISRHLVSLGLEVKHILADGSIESHVQALARLARIMNFTNREMFKSDEELVADLYTRQEERIAYTPPSENHVGKQETLR